MKEIDIFDIHSHLHSDFFKGDREEIAQQMLKENIWTISVGVSKKDSKKAINFVKNKANFYCTIGIHPTEKENFNEVFFQKILNENKDKVVGVGECGLDYYWLHKDLEIRKINPSDFDNEISRQKKLFIEQIEFASKNNLPLMLHIRPWENEDAYEDALTILEEYPQVKANFHFFTGKANTALKIQKNPNYFISIPGVCTFANLDKTLKILNMKQTMIETDSPFAAPVPFRGETNAPLYVKEVVKKISSVKTIPLEKIQKQTVKNSIKFWNIF